MTIRSTQGVTEISVDPAPDATVAIRSTGSSGSTRGLFTSEAIEALIAELAEAIGKVATLEEKPEPIPELPTNVGAIVRVDGVAYVRDGFDAGFPWSAKGEQSEYPDNWHGFKTSHLVVVSEGVS